MITIRIVLGQREADIIVITIDDVTNASEIYSEVRALGKTSSQAAECVVQVNAGNFEFVKA